MLCQGRVDWHVDLTERCLIARDVLSQRTQQQLGRERGHENARFYDRLRVGRQKVSEVDDDVGRRV